MGSSSSLPHKKEYTINKITPGKLWNFYDRPDTCINCSNDKIFAVVSYKINKQINSYNYCRSCLYFPISIQWRAIYCSGLPIDLKQRIFRRFMTVIT